MNKSFFSKIFNFTFIYLFIHFLENIYHHPTFSVVFFQRGLKRILRYLQGTLNYGLIFYKSNKRNRDYLTGFADADWGSTEDRKSTSGFVYQLFGNTICQATRRQNTVAQSSTEAEFVALATCATEYLWLKNLIKDFDVAKDCPIIIYEDNQACIHSLKKWEHKRLKHVDIKYNFVKDLVVNKEIDVKYIRTDEQTADIMTKSLTGDKFVILQDKLGLKIST